MSALVLELPEGLRAAVTGEASRRGVSESAWLAEAAREKLAAEAELAYLVARGTGRPRGLRGGARPGAAGASRSG